MAKSGRLQPPSGTVLRTVLCAVLFRQKRLAALCKIVVLGEAHAEEYVLLMITHASRLAHAAPIFLIVE